MATNPTGTSPLVTRVKNILLQPKSEWPVIDAEPATIGGIYRSYVVILAAIGPVAGAIGMLVFGIHAFVVIIRPSPVHIIVQAVVQYLLALGAVYLLALIIDALAPTFGGSKDPVKAFKVAAYGSTASWLAGIFGIIPNLAILSIVGLYSLYLYYVGLPVLMRVPQDKMVGYAISIIVAAIILFFIIGAIAVALVGAISPLAMTPGGGTVTFG